MQNALGYTLADNGRNLPEARDLLTAALAQSPDNAATLDSMGWLLYKEGNYPAALDHLQRASKSGADPEIDLHIGEVQWAMGDQAAARKTWAAALEEAPENDKLRQRLEREGYLPGTKEHARREKLAILEKTLSDAEIDALVAGRYAAAATPAA